MSKSSDQVCNIDVICPHIFDEDLLNFLLGRNVGSIDFNIMIEIWICAGKAISSMYYNVLKSRTDIG